LFLESWEGGKIFGNNTKVIDDKITSDESYKRLRQNGMNGKEALAEFTKHKKRNLWSWDGKIEKSATKIDSFKHYLTLLHTGILAAEPNSGEIKTWVGGNDFIQFPYDNIMGARQVGSAFKPIVYLAALVSGAQPCDIFDNELKTYAKYDDWTPKNSSGEYGGQVSLKGALTHSINTVSVQVLFNAGIDNVVDLAKTLGIENKLNAVPSIVLGTSDVTLLEMIQVYATLANRGEKVRLHGIKKILNRNEEILYEALPGASIPKEQVVDQSSVDMLNEMLLNVSVEGTARRLYRDFRIPYPISGKTGTTQNQSDGWYIGYNKDMVIGSWVGTMDRRIHFRNLGTGSGGATALPIVGGLFEYAGRNGYLHQKRLPDTGVEDCDEFILDEGIVVDEIMDLKDRMEQMKKDIMGEYYNVRKTPASIKKNRFQKKKRDEERDKRYKAYKQAVKELESKLEALKDQLDKLES
jgi:penicillin-binding protein 1A